MVAPEYIVSPRPDISAIYDRYSFILYGWGYIYSSGWLAVY